MLFRSDIYYLKTIPVYLDSIIRITQDIKSCGIAQKKINKLCSGDKVDDITFGQITAQSEKSLFEHEIPIIENDKSSYSFDRGEEPGEYMDDLLDILGLDEEDVDDDKDIKGGNPNNKNTTSSTIESEILSETDSPQKSSVSSSVEVTDLSIADTDVSSDQDNSSKKIKNSVNKKLSEKHDDNDNDNDEEKNKIKDITGMRLQYPNPFSSRLEDRMPELFVKSKNEKIDLYTRMCPFTLSERRQPIILTKEEKDKIIKDHPGEINEEADFIEYGTYGKNKSQKYYYTCPRYWCLLTDTMVTEQDILDGKCGPKVDNVNDSIIPKNSDTVPKGKYVYKFYEDNERKYPGFQIGRAHV